MLTSKILTLHQYSSDKIHQLEQTQRDMEQILTQTQREITNIKSRDSRAVSFADYYNEKVRDGRVLPWAPISEGTYLPTALHNPNTGSERDVVKPFWEGALSQPLLSQFENGYEAGYLGTKKPDITVYPREITTPEAHLYISFGDCKGSGWTGTSHYELGQGMQYAHRILDAQPQRRHVYGFITNNERCVLIKGVRGSESPFSIYWEITASLDFACGMILFFHYLQNENGFVRPPTVKGSTLLIEQELRPGGTCRAFIAKYKQREVVAKLYDSEEKAAQDAVQITRVNELVNAATWSQPHAKVPSVVATEAVWLLITPVGANFTSSNLKLRHLKKLLQTLKLIHDEGAVHRDVRPANFLLLEGDDVLLNDWGSVASMGNPVLVECSPKEVCHPDLIDVAEIAPEPKHDLYSLVASISDLFTSGLMRESRRAVFQYAIDAANRADHDAVASAFENIGIPQ